MDGLDLYWPLAMTVAMTRWKMTMAMTRLNGVDLFWPLTLTMAMTILII